MTALKPLWPSSVYVLTPSLFTIDGPPGCDPANYPQSLTGWVDFELRSFLLQKYGAFTIQTFCIPYNAWMDQWHKIYPTFQRLNPPQQRIRKPSTNPILLINQPHPTPVNTNKPLVFTRYDHYNATWASLGYTANQSQKALELLSLSLSNKKP